MKFHELPVGVRCGIKGKRQLFCLLDPVVSLSNDEMVYVMDHGYIAHISEFGGETCLSRDDYGVYNEYYEEIETEKIPKNFLRKT